MTKQTITNLKKKLTHIKLPFYGLFGMILIFGLYHLNAYSMIFGPQNNLQVVEYTSDETDFDTFLQDLFRKEVSSNTLNLHYSLADPSSEGITQYPISFGNVSAENESMQLALLENLKKELDTFDKSTMSTSDRLTYDVLSDSIDRSLDMAPFYYYNELLGSTNGVQSEYPILLAEYSFRTKKDVEDYLSLLSEYDDYFNQICDFEKAKSKQGLFMNRKAVDNLIEQCHAFLPEKGEKSFWETTFSERLEEIDSLTNKEKKDYIRKNEQILEEHVYPAYHDLTAVLKSLKNTGKNDQGLCYFPDGKKYYQLLVRSSTGSDRSISALRQMVDSHREECLARLSDIASSLNKTKNSAERDSKRDIKSNNLVTAASYSILPYHSPEEMLEQLKKKIQPSFPAVPETNFTVKEVSKKLEDFLSPAFYLTSPMDRFTDNCIYINPSHQSNDIQLFTTLAHEGYPGHLYQTVYTYTADLPKIRYLLYHGGYTEGWATYVEMLSYAYTGIDENLSNALMLNQDATLSLYATIDMGIHYEGWSLADTADFLGTYGITQTSVISDIYQAIIENPSNYLKYYIGYLEFLDLKKQAKEYYGNDYSELLFHTAILDMGSAPFYILEKYLTQYYQAN